MMEKELSPNAKPLFQPSAPRENDPEDNRHSLESTGLTFRKAKPEEVQTVFGLIEKRVKWMDKNGIHQWNDTDYLNVYPLSYYEMHREHGRLYVLCDESGQIQSAAVLLEQDPRWNRDEPAFYIHNLVSAEGTGTGTRFIKEAEQFAVRAGKQFLRLDSADGNAKLTLFYENLGFKPCCTCIDGDYHGILRQKILKP